MLPAQSAGSRLLVLSKRAHTLSIVDPVTLKVVGSAPVGDDPHEVIASADGRTAYVSNYGFGAFHTLAVIDLASATAQQPIDLGALTGPHGLDFVDGAVWFTAEGAKAVGRYTPATGRIDLILGTGQNRTHMIHVLPGGEQRHCHQRQLRHGKPSGQGRHEDAATTARRPGRSRPPAKWSRRPGTAQGLE